MDGKGLVPFSNLSSLELHQSTAEWPQPQAIAGVYRDVLSFLPDEQVLAVYPEKVPWCILRRCLLMVQKSGDHQLI